MKNDGFWSITHPVSYGLECVAYWNRNGIPLIKADGSEGVIETTWLSYKSDQDNEHRFSCLYFTRGAVK